MADHFEFGPWQKSQFLQPQRHQAIHRPEAGVAYQSANMAVLAAL